MRLERLLSSYKLRPGGEPFMARGVIYMSI